MSRRRRAARWWAVFVTLAILHLMADLLELGWLSAGTMVLLMPSLATYLLAARTRAGATEQRLTRLVLAALACSWLGDTVGVDFLVKLAFFLLAHGSYIAAFWPWRRGSVLSRRPVVTGYVVVVGALLWLVGRSAGPLLVPVLLYGVTLGLMAVLATGLGRAAGWGAVIFVVSDATLALTSLTHDAAVPPPQSFVVMLTYLTAQALIVRGVLEVGWSGRTPLPVPAPRWQR